MREYGAVSPQFWLGKTGKSLRGDLEAQVLAFYLMTSPHANMIGVFYCPVMYMSKETGLPLEGASKALARLIQDGFCVYDEDSETIFVKTMVEHQVGKDIKSGDKRLLGIRKEWQKIAVEHLKAAFFAEHGQAYGLEIEAPSKPLPSPLHTPPKQLTEQDRTEQEQNTGASPPDAAPASDPQDQNQGQDKTPDQAQDGGQGQGAPFDFTVTRAALLAKRIRQETQIMGVNPSNPLLTGLLDAGYSDDEILDVCHEAKEKQKGWNWVVTVVQARANEAKTIKPAPTEDRSAIFAGAV